MQHQHVSGSQFGPQCFEKISLGQGQWPDPQPRKNLIKLLLSHGVAGPLLQEIVDRLIADNDTVGLGILRQQNRLHGLLLPLREQWQP